jgi:serine/threonine-protein kinase
MIDGRGRVRITDFGLAVAAGEELPEADVSGTPPYMAPEQFAGKGASVRSDIYALGLVLYEVFTGKRAFEAKTLAELRAKKETSSPTAPSEIARDIDPIVERVILRCIEKDPRQRPASAAQVAAALPGGDPHALVAKAREILKAIGYSATPADSAFGFEPNADYFRNVEKNDRSTSRFDKLPAFAVQFWYRQSPQPVVPPVTGTLAEIDPYLMVAGESLVRLDLHGNLTGLQVIPSETYRKINAGQSPDWSMLFKTSGMQQSKCNSVAPDLTYPGYDDTRAAWTGTLPDRPNIAIRIDASARAGEPISWRIILDSRQDNPIPGNTSLTYVPAYLLFHLRQIEMPVKRVTILLFVMYSLAILGGAYFARRNLRMGRGDRRGATRLACFILVLSAISWIFGTHHVPTLAEADHFFVAAGIGVSGMGAVWLMYLGFEPFVRRRWPRVLVGWSRLLSGNFRDPLAGRDLLVGCGL